MECSLKYSLREQDGRPLVEGEAEARLSETTLAILPRFGEVLLFSLREVARVTAADYRLHLHLSSGKVLTLFHLGHRYDDFHRVLRRLCNELTLRDLLMHESLRGTGLKARYVRTPGCGSEERGDCEVRLYETALVVIPDQADLERIPYSYVAGVREEDHALALEIEDDGRLVLTHLGPEFDLLRRSLSEAMSELALAAQHRLQELIPGLEPSIVRRAAALLKDGRAAPRSALEALSPELWPRLEERLAVMGMGEKYGFLRTLARPERICIGIKRGLLGDLTGEYVWVLLPMYGAAPTEPGNALAMEATSGTGGGKATYFFRLTGRREYARQAGDLGLLHRAADAFILSANRCLLAINFRREPIYLPPERLMEPRYAHYRVAVERIPGLKMLREHFIGRVIHYSPEQWKEDVMNLLRHNVSVADDSLRWRNRAEAAEED